MTLQNIKERYDGVQTLFKKIDSDGCLFLCLCTIIEEVTGREADIAGIVQVSRKRGWLANDYTVNDSLSLLNYFTGKKFKRESVRKLPAAVSDNMFTVEKWHNEKTGYTHFKRRFVDTVLNSVTVKQGKLIEYYIYSYAS